MLIERFAPTPDALEHHEVDIAAAPEVVYRTLSTIDFSASAIIKGLLTVRSLPARMFATAPPAPATPRLTLQDILKAGFGRLAEDPGSEIVLGVVGAFWKPIGNVQPFDRESFFRAVEPGMARAVWNFRVVRRGSDGTTLSTETRVTCGDPASRLKFRLYWLLIRPFSGLIRIIMLRSIKHAAESCAA